MINHKIIGLFLFLLVFSFSFGSVKENEAQKKGNFIIASEPSLMFNDSIELNGLITKEIIYDAPKSEMVNFCWLTENFSKEELFRWNAGAKVYKNIVCISMQKNNLGQFKVSITMPKDSKTSFAFMISKDKNGVYQEIWDWQKESITFNNKEKQKHHAVYPQKEKRKTSLVVSNGWLILLTLSLVLVIVKISKVFWKNNVVKTSIVIKVVLLGIALYLFHILARSEIIGLHPKSLFYDWGKVVYLFKASLRDLFYVLLLVSAVTFALFFIKKNKFRKVVYRFFEIIVFLSALLAFVNITTVKLLGHPFKYEWLYYSDFLGSDDSLNALKENLPAFIFLNLIVISVSVFILGKILEYLLTFINTNRYLKYSISILVFVSLTFIINSSFRLANNYDDGKIENAVLAMGTSIINNDKKASFFNLPLDDNEPFKPREGTSVSLENFTQEKVIKNVVFIILESSGSKYFDAYGGKYNITPNLNDYAEKALLYRNAYAHVPATMKSMVSLLGSIYPYVSYKGLTSENPDFEHPTLPSILKKQGFQTSFFTSADLSYMKGDQFLKNRRFQTIEDFSDIKCDNNYKQEMYKEGDAIDDMCLTDRFEIWLENNNENNFFSTIWTVQGHYPYFFSQEEEDFDVDNIYFNRYLNTIKHSDQMIGDIIQVLKEKELFESTLIVVTGDHGEAFNQHGNHGHASNIYEENIRIPLYFINPLLFNGEQREDIVSMKDIASTTLSLLDIEIPQLWQGRDIISTYHDEVFFFAPFSDYLFGYRKGNKKYIFNETTNFVEVFDLLNDPNEKMNIRHQIPESEIFHAKKRIASWVQYQDKFVNEHLLK